MNKTWMKSDMQYSKFTLLDKKTINYYTSNTKISSKYTQKKTYINHFSFCLIEDLSTCVGRTLQCHARIWNGMSS